LAHAQVVLRQPSHGKNKRWDRSPEAQVWEAAAQAVGSPPPGVLWIHVGDRASDVFEFLATCVDLGKHALVRAFHDRVLAWDPDDPRADVSTAHTVLTHARTLPAHPDAGYLIHLPIQVVKGKKVAARDADVTLAWTKVTFPPPAQAPEPIRSHAPLTIWVLRVGEPAPPAEVIEPLEWILLSTLPIETLTDAWRSVERYTCRWLCEDYHQCLKTGCRIEASQLDDGADLRRLLGFALPIALRLLQLRQAVRHLPDLPAVTLIEPLMVGVLARRLHQDVASLSVTQFWHGVARLGGHQGRKSDGPPGWRTLWRGYLYLADLTDGARLVLAPPELHPHHATPLPQSDPEVIDLRFEH
jgi:hypothetical protein